MHREETNEGALDAALEMTFPASDPIAVSSHRKVRARRERVHCGHHDAAGDSSDN